MFTDIYCNTKNSTLLHLGMIDNMNYFFTFIWLLIFIIKSILWINGIFFVSSRKFVSSSFLMSAILPVLPLPCSVALTYNQHTSESESWATCSLLINSRLLTIASCKSCCCCCSLSNTSLRWCSSFLKNRVHTYGLHI